MYYRETLFPLQSAFELYGADFMIADDFVPWLLEINASPGMSPSSVDKAKLCAQVVEDTIKGRYSRSDTIYTRYCGAWGCCAYIISYYCIHVFSHILQGCFIGTEVIAQVPRCKCNNSERYG